MTRVVVCQLDGDGALQRDWDALVSHCREARPDLVVLPEMPFDAWLPATRTVDVTAWRRAVDSHRRWLARLPELQARVVVTSRPVLDPDGRRFNEGLVWDAQGGITAVHRKTYLPDSPGFFEAQWYQRGPTAFEPVATRAGPLGLLVCTELWFLEHARRLGSAGVDLLACPRATPTWSLERWLAGGRVAAICSGAYCLSSNRAGMTPEVDFAGAGWVIDPSGVMVVRTTEAVPVVTVDLDPAAAAEAKSTYPRSVDSTPVESEDAARHA